jgi:predicted DNA-binding transcriptional regulator AlpA
MSHDQSPGLAKKLNLNRFFAVGDDKRNAILRALGLSTQRDHDWISIWAAMGLSAVQKRKLWDELQAPMLTVAEVADIIEKRPKTVSGWCNRGEYPPGFPVPFDFGPRTKRWIALEIWAYKQPVIYRKHACEIARPSPSTRKILQRPTGLGPVPTTLDPMAFS